MRIGGIPKLFSILIEYQIWIARCREPNAMPKLIFKLAGCPTRIAEGNKALIWTFIVAYVP